SHEGQSADSVPTCAAVGPDDAYYVGGLSGVPFIPGAANIWRVVPGEAPEVFLSGFTQIIDLAFGSDGSLYVLQHGTGPFFSGPGSIVRIAPDGSRTTVDTQGRLDHPAGLVVGSDHALYVSNRSTAPATGEVLRIAP